MSLATAAGSALRLLAPPSYAEEIALELQEEAELRLRHESPLRVAAWCLSQVLGSIGPLLRMRLRRREAEDVRPFSTACAVVLGSAGLVATLHALGDFVRSRSGQDTRSSWASRHRRPSRSSRR